MLVTLSAAVHAREVLRFDHSPGYAPPPAEAPPAVRRVEPHRLVTWGGRWYLVAWDLDREDWRTFRADRIIPRTPTGPRFTPREVPGGDVAAFVAARFQGSDAPGEWPCRGEVILDAPASAVAGHIRDGSVEEYGPDRCRVVLGAWSWAASPPNSAGSTWTSRSSGPTGSGMPSPGWPAALPPLRGRGPAALRDRRAACRRCRRCRRSSMRSRTR